jgi:anti-sigma28 factor (negative regulator of flagellin synthesis)
LRIDEAKQAIGATIDATGGMRGGASLPDALGRGDRVRVPDTARLRARVRAGIGRLDRVRAHVVGRLRDEIERGEYRPDYAIVARNLLRDVLEHIVS